MVITYIAGLLTLPVLFVAYIFISWAFSKTHAYGDCEVCDHLPQHAIGDYYNITEWLRVQWHDLWWSHRAWHRKAVENLET